MTLLPPAGPQRTRLVALLAFLGVAVVLFLWRPWGASTTPAARAPVASNQQVAQVARAGTQGGKPATGALMPVPVNLEKLEPVPDEPGTGRNLFRFGVRPPPPAPKVVEMPPAPKIDPGPPPPPPYPPPIDLQLKGITTGPDMRSVAWLKDPKAPADSKLLSGSQGEIVDGKYKLLKVGTESVIVSYVDGSGQRTILITR